MSYDHARYLREVDAMFGRVDHQLTEIGIAFVMRLAAEVIDTTPGPNLQEPDDTEYIATGRLRGAWRLSSQPLGAATRWDGGPYTEHGIETLAEIETEIRGGKLGVHYLVNDVAYGYIVHEGLGRHARARPWVKLASVQAPTFAQEARAQGMVK